MSLPANTWELDFYSRPLLDENGKKRWEALICSSGRTLSQAWRRAKARQLTVTMPSAFCSRVTST